jgi:hypothetical protein
VIGLAMNARSVGAVLAGGLFRVGNRVPILVFVLFVLWAANRCAGPLTLYDSGMYHAPTVEWFKAYPVVPGLGNLHGRLAFNPSGLLFAAMLDRGPFASGCPFGDKLSNDVRLQRYLRLRRGRLTC